MMCLFVKGWMNERLECERLALGSALFHWLQKNILYLLWRGTVTVWPGLLFQTQDWNKGQYKYDHWGVLIRWHGHVTAPDVMVWSGEFAWYWKF